MFKRFNAILLIILMITIQFPTSLTKAFGVTNDKSSISTIESTIQTTTTTELNIPLLTQWVLDEPTNTLYAISQTNKSLYFINATTMKIDKSLPLTGGPTDIIMDSGKLYITLDDIKQIVIVDMASRVITKTLYTSSDPYRIVKDGSKLYYAERDQWCDLYSYDLITNADEVLAVRLTCNPDLAINTDKHILYIGESGSSGSNMTYYSTTDNKIIDKTNYDDGYGFGYPSRNILFDGVNVYYAGRDFISDNPKRFIGDFGGNVIFAKNNFVFTNTSIYDANTHVKLGDYGSNMDLIEASSTTMYFYSNATGSIKRFNNLNSTIDSNNIISFIPGAVATSIQSDTKGVQITPQSYNLKMNSNLTQWVLDENNNTLYAISNVDKALFFINATTLNIEKSITFTSAPTDIIMEKGKLYISLDDVNQIAVVDVLSRKATGTLYTTSDPYRIVIDGSKLYYAERDQWCNIYSYDLITNADEVLAVGLTYNPDLAINTDKHILYIGESGSSGSNMTYYSTTDNKIIGKTNYDDGYGFGYPSRNILFDGNQVYYASRDFEPENPINIIGSYGENVIFAKQGYVFTNTGAYSSLYNILKMNFGKQINLTEISKNGDLYLYSIQNNSIIKAQPLVMNGISPNNGLIKYGTVVNITGTGFSGVTKVYFGNTLGTNLIVNSDASITITSPLISDNATVDVTIIGPSGTNVINSSDKFTYTGVTVNGTATNGSITGLVQSYNIGATVKLVAVAAKGYTFQNWTDKLGNVVNTSEVYTFTINYNIELHANFIDNCDINKDGKVDILDLDLVTKNYNIKSTDITSNSDFNKDGVTDVFDLVICSKRMTK